jgi:hypothetical protein
MMLHGAIVRQFRLPRQMTECELRKMTKRTPSLAEYAGEFTA